MHIGQGGAPLDDEPLSSLLLGGGHESGLALDSA